MTFPEANDCAEDLRIPAVFEAAARLATELKLTFFIDHWVVATAQSPSLVMPYSFTTYDGEIHEDSIYLDVASLPAKGIERVIAQAARVKVLCWFESILVDQLKRA